MSRRRLGRLDEKRDTLRALSILGRRPTGAIAAAASAAPLGIFFGDGSDGDVTFSANDTIVGPKYYNNLTINDGVVVTVTGHPVIFVKDTFTRIGTGVLINNGENGSPGENNSGATRGEGGAAGVGGVLLLGMTKDGVDGVPGGEVQQNGTDGNSITEDNMTDAVASRASGAQRGAAGGNGSGTGAGTGGIAGYGETTSIVWAPRDYVYAVTLFLISFAFVADELPGGAGSGAGGETDAGAGSGGGGGHGGDISLIARHIVTGDQTDEYISVAGGAGAQGGNNDGDGGAGGGGSGGNGGLAIEAYETKTGSGTVNVSGGGGANGGTSVSGSPGETGPDGYDGEHIEIAA